MKQRNAKRGAGERNGKGNALKQNRRSLSSGSDRQGQSRRAADSGILADVLAALLGSAVWAIALYAGRKGFLLLSDALFGAWGLNGKTIAYAPAWMRVYAENADTLVLCTQSLLAAIAVRIVTRALWTTRGRGERAAAPASTFLRHGGLGAVLGAVLATAAFLLLRVTDSVRTMPCAGTGAASEALRWISIVCEALSIEALLGGLLWPLLRMRLSTTGATRSTASGPPVPTAKSSASEPDSDGDQRAGSRIWFRRTRGDPVEQTHRPSCARMYREQWSRTCTGRSADRPADLPRKAISLFVLGVFPALAALPYLWMAGVGVSSPLMFLCAFVRAMACCALYERRSYGAAVGLRAGWSIAAYRLYGFGVAGTSGCFWETFPVSRDWLTGGDLGLESGWLAVVLFLACAAVVWRYGEKKLIKDRTKT